MTRKKPAPKKTKKGRPSLYTEALAAKICRRLAEGESLRTICGDKTMPAISTVMGWLFDEALEIADDASGDWTADKDGKKTLDHEHVQRSRLRVDTRKWAAGKLVVAPYRRKYGDYYRSR